MTKQELEDKLAEFDKNDDKDSEHYCYGTFRKYLTKKNILTDNELNNYIEVAKSDEDKIMAISAILDILQKLN